MGLFGAFVRTAVNVLALPVTLPVAVAKGAVKVMEGDPTPGAATESLREVVDRLKREADEGR